MMWNCFFCLCKSFLILTKHPNDSKEVEEYSPPQSQSHSQNRVSSQSSQSQSSQSQHSISPGELNRIACLCANFLFHFMHGYLRKKQMVERNSSCSLVRSKMISLLVRFQIAPNIRTNWNAWKSMMNPILETTWEHRT